MDHDCGDEELLKLYITKLKAGLGGKCEGLSLKVIGNMNAPLWENKIVGPGPEEGVHSCTICTMCA